MTFVRYVAIQLMAYVIDMGGFLIILKFGVFGPLVANIVSKIAAGIFAFFAHRHITFQSAEKTDRNVQAVLYFTLLAINIPFSTVVFAFTLDVLDQAVIVNALEVLAQFVKAVILDVLGQPAMENRLKFFLDQPTMAKVISDVLCVLLSYWLSKTFVFDQSRRNFPVPVQSKRSEL